MNDIFLSYDSSDRAIAQQFSNALEALGWSVWWDREIPHGDDFDLVIEKELDAARCAIVLWSKEAVQSRWVRSEASAAAARSRLIPVQIEPATLPLEFRQIQTAELIGWNGDTNDPEFVRLVDSIKKQIGRDPNAIPSPPTRGAARPSRRPIVAAAIVVALIVAGIVAFTSRNGTAPSNEGPPVLSTSAPTASDTAAPETNVATSAGSAPTAQGAPDTGANTFTINIGDKIQDGAPAPGAGVIETPHEKDVYTFNARRGQNVFFRVLQHSQPMAYVEWKLIDANETEIFRSCLGCGHPGVQNLRVGGPYRLIVGSDRESAVGTYQLQLHDVPDPDRFKVSIGDVIAQDAPGPGAGTIETPGVEDVYSFEAKPRQRVYFRMREHSSGLAYVRMKLVDSIDTQIFESCLGCGEPGVQALTKGGTYTLTVGIRNDPSTGTYRLQLFDVPKPDEFTITLPAKIANGAPGPGAGFIESPGAEDRYLVQADAGQKVEFRLREFDKSMSYIQYRLITADGTELFNRCLGCSALETQTFNQAGRYVLVVGNPRDPSTGTYAMEILPK